MTARQRGSDLRYDMQITLEEAAFGVEKEIEVRKLDTCDKVQRQRRFARFTRGHLPAPAADAARSLVRVDFSRSRRPVRAAAGSGEVIEKPCDACDGEGRSREDQPDQNQDPARDRARFAAALHPQWRSGHPRRRPRRPLHRRSREGTPDLPARRRQSILRSADLIRDWPRSAAKFRSRPWKEKRV